ncbi:MAG: hypothetical protein ACYDA4_15220 [Ignavibacteriaceae bacterium]
MIFIEFSVIYLLSSFLLLLFLNWIYFKHFRWCNHAAFIVEFASAFSASVALDFIVHSAIGEINFGYVAIPLLTWSTLSITFYYLASGISQSNRVLSIPYFILGGVGIFAAFVHVYNLYVSVPLIFIGFILLRTKLLENGYNISFLKKIFQKTDPYADFAQHIPTLIDATKNIQLGIYFKLSKQYKKTYMHIDTDKLANAVVYNLTLDDDGLNTLDNFPIMNLDIIEKEVRIAVMDENIKGALALEYAGRIMAISYLSGSPFSEEYLKRSNIIVEKATNWGIEITNIVALWGNLAIIKLYEFSKKFREENI